MNLKKVSSFVITAATNYSDRDEKNENGEFALRFRNVMAYGKAHKIEKKSYRKHKFGALVFSSILAYLGKIFYDEFEFNRKLRSLKWDAKDQIETYVITALSGGFNGGNFAKITIDDKEIKCRPHENGHDRGLHMVIMDPSDGKIVMARIFDTYTSSFDLELFIDFMNESDDGFIIIVACKDDCVKNLSDKCKEWFYDMGSEEINHLEYREGYSFVGKTGARDGFDTRSM